MSEFTLPANSKVGKGKDWALSKPTSNFKSLQIYRWNPAKNTNPVMDTFHIDRDACGPMVLDALVKINDQIDPSLSFRRCVRLLCDEYRREEPLGLLDANGQSEEGH